MSDLRRLVQPLFDVPPIEPMPVDRLRSRARQRRLRRGTLAAGALVLAVGLVGGLLLARNDQRPTRTVSAGPTAPASGVSTPTVSTLEVGGATDVAVGAGSVWVPGFDVLRRIDPVANAVSATIAVPGSSDYRSVLVAFGAVWVTDTGNGTLTRVDPATNQVVASIPLGGTPGPMAAAGGLLWVAQPRPVAPGGTIVPIDPATNGVGEALTVDTTFAAPFVALSAEGDSLFAAWGTKVLQIDAHTRRIRSRDATHGTGVNVGDDPVFVLADRGTLYVLTESGHVTALDAATLAIRRSSRALGTAHRLAIDGDTLWVLSEASSTSASQLLRLDRTTLEPRGAPIEAGLTSVALASGANTTWVANFNDGTLTRVDARAHNARPELCPAPIPIERASADGLRPVESAITDRGTAEASLRASEPDLRRQFPNAASFAVGPGLGRAWSRDPAGRVTVVTVHDYAVIVRFRSRADCPRTPPTPFGGATTDNVPILLAG